jgi:cysteine sulfinate desulfinase/cysteine desulfurase-like protein
MGVDPVLARGAVRVSIGHSTTEGEVDRFLETWNTLAGSLLKENRGIAA